MVILSQILAKTQTAMSHDHQSPPGFLWLGRHCFAQEREARDWLSVTQTDEINEKVSD